MSSTEALALIETQYGSLEDFAYLVLTDEAKRDVLNESIPLVRRADLAGMPMVAFVKLMQHPDFKALLRTTLVNRHFDILAETRHLEAVAGVAQNTKRLVMSSKGTMGMVDQAPSDVIAAGKYLNELRGTPVEQKGVANLGGVQINIYNATREVQDVPITIDATASVHRPQAAGDLPPAGVLGRGAPSAPAKPSILGASGDDGVGAFYGEAAEEADAAHRAAQRAAGEPVSGPEDDEGVEERPRRGRNLNAKLVRSPWRKRTAANRDG